MQALITRITEATSLAELQAIVADIPHKTGVQNIVYHYLGQQPDGASETPRGLTTYADEWVTHYIAKDYVHYDPVIRRAETSLVPFDWGELSIDGDDQKKLFKEATDFNLGATGLSMPVRGLGARKPCSPLPVNMQRHFPARYGLIICANIRCWACMCMKLTCG